MLKVYSECCKNCLLSKDRIVSPKRANEIIRGCKNEQTYFVCHKASIEGREIVCATFYKTIGHISQMVRIAGRLRAVEFVEQPESEKLATYDELSGRERQKIISGK